VHDEAATAAHTRGGGAIMGLPYESPSGAGGYDDDDYGMSPDAAAQKWIAANPSLVNAWLQ